MTLTQENNCPSNFASTSKAKPFAVVSFLVRKMSIFGCNNFHLTKASGGTRYMVHKENINPTTNPFISDFIVNF